MSKITENSTLESRVRAYLRGESSRAETYETVENTYLRYDTQLAIEKDLREAKKELGLEVDLREIKGELIGQADEQLIRDTLLDTGIDTRSDIQDYYILISSV